MHHFPNEFRWIECDAKKFAETKSKSKVYVLDASTVSLYPKWRKDSDFVDKIVMLWKKEGKNGRKLYWHSNTVEWSKLLSRWSNVSRQMCDICCCQTDYCLLSATNQTIPIQSKIFLWLLSIRWWFRTKKNQEKKNCLLDTSELATHNSGPVFSKCHGLPATSFVSFELLCFRW